MKLKAYVVSPCDHEVCLLVFASTPGKAKHFAIGVDGFEPEDFTALSVRREPKADADADRFGPGVVDANFYAGARLMRSLGWYAVDHQGETCGWCDLYYWPNVPESRLMEAGKEMVCEECAGVQP